MHDMETHRERRHRTRQLIPGDYIMSWRVHTPWATDAQVEQDLVIGRALVELF